MDHVVFNFVILKVNMKKHGVPESSKNRFVNSKYA